MHVSPRTIEGEVSCGGLLQVADIMSSPPIAARATNKVADAAVMMLKHKVRQANI